MKVWFKRIVVGAVAVFILALLGLAIFLLTFDPNAYKSKVQELVAERYQRTLVINGDISLSLFPRIGLSVQDVSVSDRNSTTVFASVQQARVAVAIWPLLSNNLVVDHISVEGFRAWVTRSPQGVFNFQDLIDGVDNAGSALAVPAVATVGVMAPAGAEERKVALDPRLTPESAQLQIDIAGLDLKDGEVHFNDAQKGYMGRLLGVQLSTGRVTFDQPFDVTLRGKLVGDNPVADANIQGQALLRLDPLKKQYSAQKLNVQVTGLLATLQAQSMTLQGNVAYSAVNKHFDATGLSVALQGKVQGLTPEQPAIDGLQVSLTAPQLRVDPSRSLLQVQRLAVRASGKMPAESFEVAFDAPDLSVSPEAATGETVAGTLKVSGESVAGLAFEMSGLGGNSQDLNLKELKVDGTVKKADRLIRVNLSSPVRWRAAEQLLGLTAIKGDVKINAEALGAAGFEFPLIGSLQANLQKQEINSDLNAVLNGNPLSFSTRVAGFDAPSVRLNLQADELDFDKLFPVVQAAPKAAPDAAEPTLEDKAATEPASSPTGNAATPAAPAKLDLTVLDTIDLVANAKVGKLVGRGIEADNVVFDAKAQKGRLDISQVSANLYGGTASGKFSVTSKNVFGAQLNLAGVSVGPLVAAATGQDRLTGKGTLKLNLTTRGDTVDALPAGLGGSVQLALRDGVVKGFNVQQTLVQISEALSRIGSGQIPDLGAQYDLSRETQFTSLDANLNFEKGVGTLRKLAVEAPLLRVSQGSPATINLVNKTLDVVSNVRVVNTTRGQGGPDLSQLQGVTVPVRVHGPFADMKYAVEWKEIGGRVAKQLLERGLMNLLDKQAPAPSGGAQASPAPRPADPVKDLGNTLKGLLGR
ncbi:AsmA family protein [Pusillimonas minor]|uniref:AsmA family protein n=1 Tax=Pusillimonas minor TaxID=2697024 RepID=A0A842HRI4_9BURK|nr:AsmA family protein [Pusillimonas minor]MBC2770917.1 AsmA family protein [Pusillimonas minor]